MSKSREAMDRENQNINQQDADTGTPSPIRSSQTDPSTAVGGQTNYGISRESRSDFPRRSTSNRGRAELPRINNQTENQRYRQQNEPYSSTRYNQQASRQQSRNEDRYGRGGADYDRANEYQNRQWSGEDSGDFYSRSIRERAGTDDYRERNQPRGGYRSSEQNNPYANQQANDRSRNRDAAYRSYDSQNDDSSGYDGQNYSGQNYRNEQDFDRRDRQYSNQYTNRSGFNRRSQSDDDNWKSGYRNEIEAPRYEQNNESHYGAEPWFDRPGGTYAAMVRCRDLMTRDVTTCTPDTSLREVAEMMESENIGSIPVVENGRLIGLVTDRDIVCRILAEGRDTRSTTAREAMSDDLVTCLPEESIIDAIHKMGESQVRRLPVCDPTGRLRGILSVGDVALEAERDMEVAHALEQISQPSRNASRRQG